jgi:hypothetical protein
MMYRPLSLLLLLAIGHGSPVSATPFPGMTDKPVELQIVERLLSGSASDRYCIIYLLQQKRLSTEDRCKTANSDVGYIITMKSYYISDPKDLSEVERKVMEYLIYRLETEMKK